MADDPREPMFAGCRCRRRPHPHVPGLLVVLVALSGVLVSRAASGASATTVAGGNEHTCAVTTGGAVWCWGANWGGQLGNGTSMPRLTPVEVSPRLPPLDVTAVAAGDGHTCAVTREGAVWCWGDNRAGQLGDGTTTWRPTPVAVSGLGDSVVVALTAGWAHTCAVTSAGAVLCWGSNADGQLGDGTTTNRLTPVVVSGLGSGATVVSAAARHTCAVTSAGAAWCWGWNGSGQLGDGTTTAALTPVAVSYLGSGVAGVTTGHLHSCAVTGAGAVWCWGSGGAGQLGDGTRTDALTPVSVSGLGSGVVAADLGRRPHLCADRWRRGVVLGQQSVGRRLDGVARDSCRGERPREWRGGRRGGNEPHVRGDERRRGDLLGLERLRSTRRRHVHVAVDAGGGERSRERCGGRHRSRLGFLRGDDDGRGPVLGLERQRSAWRRHDDMARDTGGGDRPGKRGGGRVGERRARLCADLRGRGLVLGQQLVGPAGRRHHDVAVLASGRERPWERRGGSGRPFPAHLCGDRRRRGRVLGPQRHRSARRRHHDHAAHAGGGERPRGRRRGCHGRLRSHLCADGCWRGLVLGPERLRSAWRRNDDQRARAGGRERAREWHGGHRRGQRSHLRGDERGRGPVLGPRTTPVSSATGRTRVRSRRWPRVASRVA